MRQFFISFMGALAGIWLSVMIAFIGGLIVLGAAGASMISRGGGTRTTIEKSSVIVVDLATTVDERTNTASAFASLLSESATAPISLDRFIPTLRKASSDKSISGIILKGGGISAGMAQIQEIIRAIEDFKLSGKWVYAYGDGFTQADYLIASTADSIYINPQGTLSIQGLSSTTMFFKGLMDKLGIEAQVVKVGTFKSAVEPYTLTQMSEANRQQVSSFISAIWKDLGTTMGKGRGLSFEAINEIADSACYARETAFYLNHALVDGTMYSHEFDEMIGDLTGRKSPNYISLDEYATLRSVAPGSTEGKKQIAVLYAVGNITEDADEGIASSRLVPEIFDLAENDNIDGLILRVNSGGGSAYASEQIWEALEQYKKRTGNPFYVSMSDMAASGGYYISCGADRIYAEPSTLTGSIGIFGIIPEAETLLSKHLGITTETVSTNPQGQFPSFFKPMTAMQRNAMQRMVNNGYELFVKRCAEGRGMSIDSIKAIAEGRVWAGTTALEIGLVDQLGGLEEAIADMKEAIGGEECRISLFPDEKYDFMTDLKRSISIASTQAIRAAMGDAYPFYEAQKQFKNMSSVQCRTDFMIIE